MQKLDLSFHGQRSYRSGGWNASIVGNINRYGGIEMDVGCCQRPGSLNTRQSTFTFGPHFSYRSIRRVHPFAHSLLGLVNGRQFASGYHTSWRPGFAFVFGGGIDVRVMNALWIRAVQLDYFHESFRDDVQRNADYPLVWRFDSDLWRNANDCTGERTMKQLVWIGTALFASALPVLAQAQSRVGRQGYLFVAPGPAGALSTARTYTSVPVVKG